MADFKCLFGEWTKEGKGGNKETRQDDIEVMQMSDDGGIANSEQSWIKDIFWKQNTGLTDELNVQCNRKR